MILICFSGPPSEVDVVGNSELVLEVDKPGTDYTEVACVAKGLKPADCLVKWYIGKYLITINIYVKPIP